MIKLFKGKFYVMKMNIFLNFSIVHIFFSSPDFRSLINYLRETAEWLRIYRSFRSSVVKSSKVVQVLIHSVWHLSSAVEELWTILMMAAIKPCWSCFSQGLPVSPLVNDLKLSVMFGFSLHTFESVSQKFWCFFCLCLASLFTLCKRLIKQ